MVVSNPGLVPKAPVDPEVPGEPRVKDPVEPLAPNVPLAPPEPPMRNFNVPATASNLYPAIA